MTTPTLSFSAASAPSAVNFPPSGQLPPSSFAPAPLLLPAPITYPQLMAELDRLQAKIDQLKEDLQKSASGPEGPTPQRAVSDRKTEIASPS